MAGGGTGRVHLNPQGRQQASERRPIVRLDERTLQLVKDVSRRQLGRHVIACRGFAVGSVKQSLGAAQGADLDPKEVTAYALHHTAATWMAQGGVPPWEIASNLGQKDMRLVELHDAHHHPDYIQRAQTALGRQLARIPL